MNNRAFGSVGTRIQLLWMGIMLAGPLVFSGDLSVDNLNVLNKAKIYGQLEVMKEGVPTNGPKLYYSFNSVPTGSLVRDESFYGNDGTVYNAAWTNTGAYGGSHFFNNGSSGGSQYINVSFDSTLQLTGPFTLAAWIKPVVARNDSGIIVKGAQSSSMEYALGYDAQGRIYVSSSGAGEQMYFVTDAGLIQTGIWTFVVAVCEGAGTNQTKVYKNGVVVYRDTITLPTATSSLPLYIGRWRDSYYFPGYIDEVRIFDRGISSNEVVQLYTNGLHYTLSTNTVLQTESNSVHVTGSLSVDSTITAGSFSGSGAGLSDLPPAVMGEGSISNDNIAANAVTGDKVLDGTLTISDVSLSSFDSRYLNADGDSIVGALIVSNNLAVTGTNTAEVFVGSAAGLSNFPSYTAMGLGSAAINASSTFAPSNLSSYAGSNLSYSNNQFHANSGYSDAQATAAVTQEWPHLDTDDTDDFSGSFNSLSDVPAGLADGDDDAQWDGQATGLDAGTARTSLGLGTAATNNETAFAPSDLSGYAGSNLSYSNGQFHASSGYSDTQATNAVAQAWTNLDTDATDDFSGSFTNLTDIPTGLADGDDDAQWNGQATGLDAGTARASLGLGSAATSEAEAFAPSNLASYAGSNLAYSNNQFHAVSGYSDAQATNAAVQAWPNLDTDASDDFSGSFAALSGIPTGLADGDDDALWNGSGSILNVVSARENLGLGTAATNDSSAFAPANLADYAGSNLSYSNGQFHASSGYSDAQVTNAVKQAWPSLDTDSQDELPLSGGTMAGPLNMGTNRVTDLAVPTSDKDAINKEYLRSVLSKLPQQGDLGMGIYTNGSSGDFPLTF